MQRRQLAVLGLAWLGGAKAAHATGRPGIAPAAVASPSALLSTPHVPGAPHVPFAPGAAPSAQHAPSASLRLLSEEFAPISFTEGGQPRGLSVEVVHAIQQRLGQALPIEFMPWARAFREVQEGPPAALFSTARILEREKLFHWVGPIVQFQSAFYARAGSGLKLRTMAEGKRVSKVLVVRDWFTRTQLRTAGFRNLQEVTDPIQGVRMLAAGRAPLLAAERLTMPSTLAQAGLPPKALVEVFSFASSAGYIAFSRNTPPGTVAAWQAELNEMKRDGSFQAIYRRWFPAETPPR